MLERETQSQTVLMAMQASAGFAAKDACEMKRGAENGGGQARADLISRGPFLASMTPAATAKSR